METVYRIRDTAGRLRAEHVRVERPGEKKQTYWRLPGRPASAGLGGLSTPALPLYGSELLTLAPPGVQVVVTEGEKAAGLLRVLYPFALGTVTGAGSTPGEDALAVLLPYDVVLWPDYDLPGDGHMARVAATLLRLGGRARRLSYGLDKGDDAADFIARGGTRGALARLLAAATPWVVAEKVLPRPAPRQRYTLGDGPDAGRRERARARLLDVVVERWGAPARRDSSGYWWSCPFHAERTPSFKVDAREPFFRCFGCGARGDALTFLQTHAGMGYRVALDALVPGLGGIPRLGYA